MRPPTGDLTKTPWEALGVLLESHFPAARINRQPKRSPNITKTGANTINWHMARKVIKEDRMRWVLLEKF